jgi:hypothetical protein
MKVSMDGLRWQLLSNYNSLTRKLNHYRDGNQIVMDVSEVERQMEGLRSCIVTLAYMYQEGEDGFETLKDPFFEEFNTVETE